MKKCTKCKEFKELTCFSKRSASKDGLSSQCRDCCSKRGKIYRKIHVEEIRESARIYRENHKEEIKEYHQVYYQKNKPIYYERNKDWNENNREQVRALWRKSAKKPKNMRRHKKNEATRRARKIKATPKWLSDEQLQEIRVIYDNCPEGSHVDHIVPLKGKEVCGLHVPWNLQYLTASQNFKKNNKLIL